MTFVQRWLLLSVPPVSCLSNDLIPRTHPAALMPEHVAMKHPLAGVVRLEGDGHGLAWLYKNSVAPETLRFAARVGHLPHVMAVEMHRMRPGCLVDHPYDSGFPSFQNSQGLVGKTNRPIEGPGFFMFSHKFADAELLTFILGGSEGRPRAP